MKKILFPLILLVLFISSCSDDPEPLTYNELIVDVDGVPFRTSNVNVSQQFELVVSGSDGINTIKIFTPNVPTIGTHQLGTTNASYYAEYLSGSQVYTSTTGTLTIYEVVLNSNNQVDYFEADFDFTGVSNSQEQVHLSNGSILFIY